MTLGKGSVKKLIAVISALLVALYYQLTTPEIPVNVESVRPTVTSTPSTLGTEIQTVKVIRVVDGDTIQIESGAKVRYIGMDTPETSDPRKPVQCFGEAATEKNRELVEGKLVRLEKDVSETDRNGRLLRYVYVGEIMVNEKLVLEGFARAKAYPPDIKYQDKLRAAEVTARQENRGLWKECEF